MLVVGHLVLGGSQTMMEILAKFSASVLRRTLADKAIGSCWQEKVGDGHGRFVVA